MSVQPPPRISIMFCPECGRDDRFRAFTGKRHGLGGKWCPGQPVKLDYVFYTVAHKTAALCSSSPTEDAKEQDD